MGLLSNFPANIIANGPTGQTNKCESDGQFANWSISDFGHNFRLYYINFRNYYIKVKKVIKLYFIISKYSKYNNIFLRTIKYSNTRFYIIFIFMHP